MATPQEALQQFLAADSNVTALVATDPDNGTPAIGPEGSVPENIGYPRITYFVIDWPIGEGLSGPTGYAHPRIQVDVRAKGATGYDDAWKLEEAIRNSQGGIVGGRKLSGFAGIFAGCDIRHIRLADRRNEREDPIHSEEFPVQRVILDFIVEFVDS